jgi:hypothetical protein
VTEIEFLPDWYARRGQRRRVRIIILTAVLLTGFAAAVATLLNN